MNKNVLIFLVLAILLSFAVYLLFSESFYPPETNPEEPSQNATSTENKNEEGITTSDSKSGVVFTYPENLDYQYVSAESWPPRFINSDNPIRCELDEQAVAMSGFTVFRTEIINGTSYCIRERSEGAAGSVFVDYEVIYQKDSDYLTMSFTLRYPQCGNYPADEQTSCQQEQDDFPLYTLIDKIAQSSYLPNYGE